MRDDDLLIVIFSCHRLGQSTTGGNGANRARSCCSRVRGPLESIEEIQSHLTLWDFRRGLALLRGHVQVVVEGEAMLARGGEGVMSGGRKPREHEMRSKPFEIKAWSF